MSILCENLFLKVIFFLSCCDYFTFFLLTYHQYQILIAFYFVMTDGITEMSYWIISYFPLTVFTKSLYFSMYYLKRVNYLTATTPRSSEGFQHQLICCTRRKAICRAELPDLSVISPWGSMMETVKQLDLIKHFQSIVLSIWFTDWNYCHYHCISEEGRSL